MKCPTCGGNGRVHLAGHSKECHPALAISACSLCDGTGEVSDPINRVPMSDHVEEIRKDAKMGFDIGNAGVKFLLAQLDAANSENSKLLHQLGEQVLEIDAANAKIAEQAVEIERLKDRYEQRKKTGTARCAFCGWIGERRPVEESITETVQHAATCGSHPMRKLEAEIERLKADSGIRQMKMTADEVERMQRQSLRRGLRSLAT
jgi:hypothetical protein